MVQFAEKVWTLEEFLKLPNASEYRDGKIFQKPMPQPKHSRLQGKLVAKINDVCETPKIALAFPELRCTFGGRSIVPYVSVLTWDKIPVNEAGELINALITAPDWMIEILFPDQRRFRRNPTRTSLGSRFSVHPRRIVGMVKILRAEISETKSKPLLS